MIYGKLLPIRKCAVHFLSFNEYQFLLIALATISVLDRSNSIDRSSTSSSYWNHLLLPPQRAGSYPSSKISQWPLFTEWSSDFSAWHANPLWLEGPFTRLISMKPMLVLVKSHYPLVPWNDALLHLLSFIFSLSILS